MNIFSITWDGADDLIWSLNGINRTASARDLSVRCPTDLQFQIKLNWTNPITQQQYSNFQVALATAMSLKPEQLILTGATVQNTITTYTFSIRENLNVSDVTAKAALLQLLDMRNNFTKMDSIVDPNKQNLGIQFAGKSKRIQSWKFVIDISFLGISMLPTGVEVSTREITAAKPIYKRSIASLFENNKRYENSIFLIRKHC